MRVRECISGNSFGRERGGQGIESGHTRVGTDARAPDMCDRYERVRVLRDEHDRRGSEWEVNKASDSLSSLIKLPQSN